jgi:hypothetical protein
MLLAHEIPADFPDKHDGKSMRAGTSTELNAAAVWIDNWQRMLPVVNCSASLVPPVLKQLILHLLSAPIAVMAVKRELYKAQPVLLRAAIIDLLRIGGIGACTLRMKRLSLNTMLEPGSWLWALRINLSSVSNPVIRFTKLTVGEDLHRTRYRKCKHLHRASYPTVICDNSDLFPFSKVFDACLQVIPHCAWGLKLLNSVPKC